MTITNKIKVIPEKKKFTTSMNRKVCWEDGYNKCKENVIKLIDELDDMRTIDQFRKELKQKIEGKMKTQEIFKRTIKELEIPKEDLYFGDNHLTPLGLAILTASMIGSGEIKQKIEGGK